MELTPKTRKETFLAAAGGQDVTTPTPITREEVFLDEIAKGGGGSSLPSTETASAGDVLSLDDNKEPQWVAPSGGGGVLVVHGTTVDNVTTLDKTWQEIVDAGFSVLHTYDSESDFTLIEPITGYMVDRESPDMPLYIVFYNGATYSASSADGYPDNGDPGR